MAYEQGIIHPSHPFMSEKDHALISGNRTYVRIPAGYIVDLYSWTFTPGLIPSTCNPRKVASKRESVCHRLNEIFPYLHVYPTGGIRLPFVWRVIDKFRLNFGQESDMSEHQVCSFRIHCIF